jgi:sporulation protein YlmC with PRC-barrel domain
MRIDLAAKVRTRDGQDVGQVEHVTFDPSRNEVTGVVVDPSEFLAGDEVIVPRQDIERAERDGDVLVLDLTRDEFERLNRYEPARYTPPPVGWEPPLGGLAWGIPTEAFLWAAPTEPEAPYLEKGAPVLDRSGDEVGVVEDLAVDPESGRVERFTVRLGGPLARLFGRAQPIELLPSDVEHVEDGAVRLARDKEDIARR